MRSPSNVRLFIALWPSDAVRDAIVQWQSGWQWPEKAYMVKPERLHVTLHFLGDVPSERILDLKYVLQPIRAQQFELHFTRPETWQQGVAVLRPDNSPTVLRGLHARIGLALAEIGLPVDERSYRPHVTLARKAAGATPPAHLADILWQSKGGFALVQTLGSGRGYEILERFGAA
jgi:2'-5' RNA ligase